MNESHIHPVFEDGNHPIEKEEDHDEMHANLTLAYRHLEDAAMRIGKAIQAFDGGKSVYEAQRWNQELQTQSQSIKPPADVESTG